MLNSGRKLPFALALFVVALIALGVGCRGFFVNQPDSLSVTTGKNGSGSSTFTVAQGQTTSLFATATYSDGGNKDVTNSAAWQSSSPCAPVNAGTVRGVAAVSSVTITASVAGVSGSATGSVTGSGGQSLTISSVPTGPFSLTSTQSVQFSAANGSTDVTNSATWTSSDTSVLAFSSSTPGLASLINTGSSTVTASVASGNSCANGTLAVTVNQ